MPLLVPVNNAAATTSRSFHRRNTGALLAQATSGFNDIILYNPDAWDAFAALQSLRAGPLTKTLPIWTKGGRVERLATESTTLDVNSYTLRAHIQFKFLTYGNSRIRQQSSHRHRFIAPSGKRAMIGKGCVWPDDR